MALNASSKLFCVYAEPEASADRPIYSLLDLPTVPDELSPKRHGLRVMPCGVYDSRIVETRVLIIMNR